MADKDTPPVETAPDPAAAAAAAAELAPVPPKITKTGKPKETYYFCLNADHPGTIVGRAELYDESRHFTSSDGGAPQCPRCVKPGSALVVADPSQLPPSIQLIKDRFDAAERTR